ncbi:hypothetical protein FHQ08_12425 [Lactobacillus sp. CC-MHH1034]|uniref:hypothetical protein n=1 Tax=Agrilactobacillus fermenti TaxID=2586909 RepID=UPI001E2C915D|nr:hypothetical protein [Agrilactobacillus fermenti]MCD2257491.1 hypothetical protein [Agrilactobacillus fermenti]
MNESTKQQYERIFRSRFNEAYSECRGDIVRAIIYLNSHYVEASGEFRIALRNLSTIDKNRIIREESEPF